MLMKKILFVMLKKIDSYIIYVIIYKLKHIMSNKRICDEYWIGPYKIKVKNYVPYVPAKDGINKVMCKDGKLVQFTDIKNTIDLTIDEYLNKFCYYDEDEGFYRYNASLNNIHNLYIYIDNNDMPHFCNIHELIKQRKKLQRRCEDAEDDCCIIS